MKDNKNTKRYDLEDRTYKFAKNVRLLIKKLPKNLANKEDGKQLIKFTRDNIEFYLENNRRIIVPDNIKQKFEEKYGVFVTLNKYKHI